jgi:type VI protein secretion system component VasK
MPGGRALLSVWKSAGPYYLAVGNALEQHVGLDAATRFLASRNGLPDEAALRGLLTQAAFHEVEIRSSTMIVRLPSIETFVLGHLAGNPVASAVAAVSEERRAVLAKQVRTALQRYSKGNDVAVPEEVNIAIGRKQLRA